MNKYRNWKGSRIDLLKIINSIEDEDPEKYMMFSKKLNKYLPVNMRRIQDFIDRGILPSGEIENKSFIYSSEHLFRYLGAIDLKNSGHTLVQVEKILSHMHTEEILGKLLKPFTNYGNFINEKQILNNLTDLPKKLKILGREEGRVLRSQWMKFAVTKWCHMDIQKKELKNLSISDIDIITQAVKEILIETSEIKNLDRTIA